MAVPLQQNLPEAEIENDIWNTNPSTCSQKETPETGGEQDVPLWLNAGVDHPALSVFWHLRKAGVFPQAQVEMHSHSTSQILCRFQIVGSL